MWIVRDAIMVWQLEFFSFLCHNFSTQVSVTITSLLFPFTKRTIRPSLPDIVLWQKEKTQKAAEHPANRANWFSKSLVLVCKSLVRSLRKTTGEFTLIGQNKHEGILVDKPAAAMTQSEIHVATWPADLPRRASYPRAAEDGRLETNKMDPGGFVGLIRTWPLCLADRGRHVVTRPSSREVPILFSVAAPLLPSLFAALDFSLVSALCFMMFSPVGPQGWPSLCRVSPSSISLGPLLPHWLFITVLEASPLP